LLIVVVGSISGKIEPGEKARLISGVIGVVFIALGLAMPLLQKPLGVSESPGIVSQTKPDALESSPQKSTPGAQIPKQKTTSSDQPYPITGREDYGIST
jgi:hypothetical protein